MAEYRLAKVATELNRSFQVLADLLNQQGFDVMPKPTTKITEDMYQALLREFSADKAAKDEAKLLKSHRDPKPAPAAPVATKPTTPVEVLAKVEAKITTPEPISQEKIASKLEELAGPKIIGKIDIGKKKIVEAPTKKEEAPAVDVVAEPVVVEKPIAVAPVAETPTAPVVETKTPEPIIEAPVVTAPAVDTAEDDEVEKIDTKFETLSGPKVVQVTFGAPIHDSWKHFLDVAYWNVELED